MDLFRMNKRSGNRPSMPFATCEIRRNVGPRGIHGGVTLEFAPATVFAFSSSANWPKGDDYDAYVEKAVREALAEIGVTATLSCRLTAITWREVDSCAVGFMLAARHATFASFDKKQFRGQ
jgi:hypothetical protein